MNKAEFLKEVKKVDFNKLKKADNKTYNGLVKFTQAIDPKIVGKELAPGDKKPHEGELPKEIQTDLDTLFKGLKSDYSQVFKTDKKKDVAKIIKSKLAAFKIALSLEDNSDVKAKIKSKIKAFEIALSVSKQFKAGGNVEKTYDVYFNDEQDSNNKGFKYTKEDAIDYIKNFNGTSHSYFGDYKGGTVSVVCNETGENVYEEEIK